MQSSKTPYQIDGANSYDFLSETFGKNVYFSIVGIVKSGNQDAFIQNKEIGVTRR
jgi:hypothetical protein